MAKSNSTGGKRPQKHGDYSKFYKNKSTKTAKAGERSGSSDGPKKRVSKRAFDKPKSKTTFKAKPTKNIVAPANPYNKDGFMRLNKFIAHAGVCSRREADKYIETGMVNVNGEMVTELGFKVKASDKISLDGKKLVAEELQYILLNKPRGFISTVDDPHGRKTVMDLVKTACNERIYPVGRLDRDTTGLLLFTNDGDLTKKLTHPKFRIRKMYHVVLDKELSKNDLIKLVEGMDLEDGHIAFDKASWVEQSDRKNVGVELHSGRNRIVRRVFEHLGYRVIRLDRVLFASLSKRDLPRGKWRRLSPSEINFLKML